MGPDESTTREELGLIVRFMIAKFRQQSEMITELISLLQDKRILTNEEILSFANRLEVSERSKAAVDAYEKLHELAAVHKTVRQYLDPPEG